MNVDKQETRSQKNLALIVIGCNYSGTKYQLEGCLNDAMDFANTVVSLADQSQLSVTLKLLLDKGGQSFPSKSTIINVLTSTINQTNSGIYDGFIFYYAGHGFQYQDRNSDEKDYNDESILCADLKPLIDDELFVIISNLNRGKQASFIFDCCHSGSILDLPKVPIGGGSSHSGRMGVPAKIACISACSESGKSIEKKGRGLFTSSFCRLLRKRGLTSKITPILNVVKTYLENNNTNMTVTVSCSRQIAIQKSSLINLQTIRGNNRNIKLKRWRRKTGRHHFKTRGLGALVTMPVPNRHLSIGGKQNRPGKLGRPGNKQKNRNIPAIRECQQNKRSCYIDPFYVRKNPTMNVNLCRQNRGKNCLTSLDLPWKPRAIRNFRGPTYT